jgi:hypothetical protein
VFASFFVVDEESIGLAAQHGSTLRFEHPWADGCRISDLGNPEGAVGYTPEALARMLRRSGMALAQPVHPGSWCGRADVPDVRAGPSELSHD